MFPVNGYPYCDEESFVPKLIRETSPEWLVVYVSKASFALNPDVARLMVVTFPVPYALFIATLNWACTFSFSRTELESPYQVRVKRVPSLNFFSISAKRLR